MSYPAPAAAPSLALGVLMPLPGPLGRLVRRRRIELGLTQKELNERTRELGLEFGQNNISRLESGITHRVNDYNRLTILGKALEVGEDREFIYIAFGPKNAEAPSSDEARVPDLELLVRVLAASLDLSDAEVKRLRIFARHVAETADASGPAAEERLVTYARELVARRGEHAVRPTLARNQQARRNH